MVEAEIIGYAASIIVVLGYFPQIYQGLKTKETKDLSLPMVALFFAGSLLFAIYGYMIDSIPLLITNITLMLCQTVLLYLKFKYGKK